MKVVYWPSRFISGGIAHATPSIHRRTMTAGDSVGDAAMSSIRDMLLHVPDPLLRQFASKLDAARCPRELEGRWKIDAQASQGLCPFLKGLGMPGIMCPAVGLLERTTELTISCPGPTEGESSSGGGGAERVRIEDKTALSSRNVTEVTVDGREVEKATKTGRKRFMLSGVVVESAEGGVGGATSVVKCRLFQRGDGWETRQERSLCAAGAAAGDGSKADSEGGKASRAPAPEPARLRERNVLVRPGEEDVVVDRYFTRVVEPAASPPPSKQS